jgi:hypothetical protein
VLVIRIIWTVSTRVVRGITSYLGIETASDDGYLGIEIASDVHGYLGTAMLFVQWLFGVWHG